MEASGGETPAMSHSLGQSALQCICLNLQSGLLEIIWRVQETASLPPYPILEMKMLERWLIIFR